MGRVLASGVVKGGNIHFTRESYLALIAEFQPHKLKDAKRIMRRFKLGDFVAFFAQPIARILDRVFRSNIEGCQACQRRKAWLNRW